MDPVNLAVLVVLTAWMMLVSTVARVAHATAR